MAQNESKKNPKPFGWGPWFAALSRIVGIMSDVLLAELIGTSAAYLSVLKSLPNPPYRMSAGLNRNFCIALRTTPVMLFNGYKSVAPADAPILSEQEARAAAHVPPTSPVRLTESNETERPTAA